MIIQDTKIEEELVKMEQRDFQLKMQYNMYFPKLNDKEIIKMIDIHN
jgi:hypothetical protein